jgi:hypothetical protein
MATYDASLSSERLGHPDLRDRKIRLHWGSIFGGGVVGWGVLFLLSLLGMTIGFAAIEPYSARPASGLDVGSAIWTVVALVLCAVLGAYLIVRFAGERRRREAVLHGVVSWGLSMITGALLAMGAGSTAVRAAAENAPRTSARADASGNVRMSRADRERLDETRSAAAKGAGLAAAASFLSLLGAMFGAGLGTAAVAGRRRGARDLSRDIGRTSSVGAGLGTDAADRDLSDRDQPTILPPTH